MKYFEQSNTCQNVTVNGHFHHDCHQLWRSLEAHLALFLNGISDDVGDFQTVIDIACHTNAQMDPIAKEEGTYDNDRVGKLTVDDVLPCDREIIDDCNRDHLFTILHMYWNSGESNPAKLYTSEDMVEFPANIQIPFAQKYEELYFVTGEIRIRFSGFTTEQNSIMAVLVLEEVHKVLSGVNQIALGLTHDNQIVKRVEGSPFYFLNLDSLCKDELTRFLFVLDSWKHRQILPSLNVAPAFN